MDSSIEIEDFKNEVLLSPKPVLVFFWRPGCPACSGISEIVQELRKEVNDQALVSTMNILVNPEVAQEYKIPAVPTIIIFKDGQVKERAVGLRSKEVLIEKIKLYGKN